MRYVELIRHLTLTVIEIENEVGLSGVIGVDVVVEINVLHMLQMSAVEVAVDEMIEGDEMLQARQVRQVRQIDWFWKKALAESGNKIWIIKMM